VSQEKQDTRVWVEGNDAAFGLPLVQLFSAMWAILRKPASFVVDDLFYPWMVAGYAMSPLSSRLLEILSLWASRQRARGFWSGDLPPLGASYGAVSGALARSDEDVILFCKRRGKEPSLRLEIQTQNLERIPVQACLNRMDRLFEQVCEELDKCLAASGEGGENTNPQAQDEQGESSTSQGEEEAEEDPILEAMRASVFPALADIEALKEGLMRAYRTCFPSGCSTEWERWLWSCTLHGMMARLPELPEVMAFGGREESDDG
jgi:hypothetical protein